MKNHLIVTFRSKYSAYALTLVVIALVLIGIYVISKGRAASADINGDGSVGIADLSILASNFGKSGMTFAQGDLNGDGAVNIADLSILASGWGTSGSTNPVPTGAAPQGLTLQFDDEFNGTSLDTSKWEPSWLGGNKPDNGSDLNCVEPSQVTVGGGNLSLTTAQQTCTDSRGSHSWISGEVDSAPHYTFTHGYFEGRIFLPPGSGAACMNFAAFWADGQVSGSIQWPMFGESDVMECLGGSPTATVHAGPAANSDTWKHPIGSLGITSGWHIYGGDFEPTTKISCSGSTPNPVEFTYYYDGVQLGSPYDVCISNTGMFIIIDNNVNPTYGGANQAGTSMLVDYVRAWQ